MWAPLAHSCPGTLPFRPSCPGPERTRAHLGRGWRWGELGAQVAGLGGGGSGEGVLGRNPTPVRAPPPAQMARARAGPGPRFRARVSAARGGAGARGPLRPRPINRQAGTPATNHGSARPPPPRHVLCSQSLWRPSARRDRAARLPASRPATSDPRGPGCVHARVCAGPVQACPRALRAPPPGTDLPVALHTRVPAAAPV